MAGGNGCPEIVLDGFLKNATQRVVGLIQEYKGQCRAHIRIFVPDEEGKYLPTPKGVSIPLDQLGALRDGLEKLTDVAATNRVVGAISVGKDQIRIGTHTYKGNQYVYVRQHYQKDGEWHPTQKGVDVRTELLDSLVDLAKSLQEAAGSPN